jgi:hypothetical protein
MQDQHRVDMAYQGIVDNHLRTGKAIGNKLREKLDSIKGVRPHVLKYIIEQKRERQ